MGTFDQAPTNSVPFDGSTVPDPFDGLLVSTCKILEKVQYGSVSDDAYGLPPQGFNTLVASWPCRRSIKRGGKEYHEGKEFATNTFIFFMRPPTQTDSQVAFNLTTHHWLQLNDDLDPDDNNYDTALYNIVAVDDPSNSGHHLEVSTLAVQP